MMDMIAGRLHPELGGAAKYLDIVGVNHYRHNQWAHNGRILDPGDPGFRFLSEMLLEVYQRYRRPLFIAETGIEDEARPAWLGYVCEQTRLAQAAGADIHGLWLYPILNFPGWDNDRHCHNGLWDYADEHGERFIYKPLAAELTRLQKLFPHRAFQPNLHSVHTPPA